MSNVRTGGGREGAKEVRGDRIKWAGGWRGGSNEREDFLA